MSGFSDCSLALHWCGLDEEKYSIYVVPTQEEIGTLARTFAGSGLVGGEGEG